jgi:hypothetical protein
MWQTGFNKALPKQFAKRLDYLKIIIHWIGLVKKILAAIIILVACVPRAFAAGMTTHEFITETAGK